MRNFPNYNLRRHSYPEFFYKIPLPTRIGHFCKDRLPYQKSIGNLSVLVLPLNTQIEVVIKKLSL
jgi:hypothetical protein